MTCFARRTESRALAETIARTRAAARARHGRDARGARRRPNGRALPFLPLAAPRLLHDARTPLTTPPSRLPPPPDHFDTSRRDTCLSARFSPNELSTRRQRARTPRALRGRRPPPRAMGIASQLKARLGESRYKLLQVRRARAFPWKRRRRDVASRRPTIVLIISPTDSASRAVRQRGVSARAHRGRRVLRHRAGHPRRRRELPPRALGQAPERVAPSGPPRASRTTSRGARRARRRRRGRRRARARPRRAPRRFPPPADADADPPPPRRLRGVVRVVVRGVRRRRRRRRRRRGVLLAPPRRRRRRLLPDMLRRESLRRVRAVHARAVRRVPRAVDERRRELLRRREARIGREADDVPDVPRGDHGIRGRAAAAVAEEDGENARGARRSRGDIERLQ